MVSPKIRKSFSEEKQNTIDLGKLTALFEYQQLCPSSLKLTSCALGELNCKYGGISQQTNSTCLTQSKGSYIGTLTGPTVADPEEKYNQ